MASAVSSFSFSLSSFDPQWSTSPELLLGFGFRVLGFGSQVSGLGSRVSGFGFRVSGLGSRVPGLGFRVSDFGFRVSNFGFWVSVFGSRVSGFGFRVSRFGFRVSNSGSRVSGRNCSHARKFIHHKTSTTRSQGLVLLLGWVLGSPALSRITRVVRFTAVTRTPRPQAEPQTPKLRNGETVDHFTFDQ